jgi:hypothetical protein
LLEKREFFVERPKIFVLKPFFRKSQFLISSIYHQTYTISFADKYKLYLYAFSRNFLKLKIDLEPLDGKVGSGCNVDTCFI